MLGMAMWPAFAMEYCKHAVSRGFACVAKLSLVSCALRKSLYRMAACGRDLNSTCSLTQNPTVERWTSDQEKQIKMFLFCILLRQKNLTSTLYLCILH